MDAVQHRYLKAFHAKVCHSCSNLSADLGCRLANSVCPIENNLREIVQIAQYVSGDSAKPYRQELRSTVCAACGSGPGCPPAQCPASEVINCPVDRYLELVFEAIDEVRDQIGTESAEQESAIKGQPIIH